MRPTWRGARQRWRVRSLATAHASGCTAATTARTTLRFWAMGREGEVVSQLVPEFERAHPGVRVEDPAAAVERRARKAADRVRGRHARPLPARQHLDSRVRCSCTRSTLDARVAASRVIRRTIISPDLGHQRSTANSMACPGMSIRGCCSIAATCSRAPASTAPPATWDEWRGDDGSDQAASGPGRYAILLPLNEFEPLLALRPAAGLAAAPRRRTTGQLPQRGFHACARVLC